MEKAKIPVTCSVTGKTVHVKPTNKGRGRLPQGWKRVGGAILSAEAMHQRYVLRAVTLPVVALTDGEWPEFRTAVKRCWQHGTALANWASTTLRARDVVRTSETEKLPPMPAVYLYGEAQSGFKDWDEMDKKSAQSILRQAEAKYRSQRYDVIWTGAATLRTERYPMPFPIPDYRAEIDRGNGRISVSFRLGGRRWTVLVAGSPQYRRQLAGLEHLISNPDLAGEIAIYQVAAGGGDNRNGDHGSGNSSAQSWHTRLMVKFAGWMLKPTSERDGTLFVRTAAESLLVALDAKNSMLWTYHADHARRAVARHEKHLAMLGRLSDDRKAETRRPHKARQGILGMLKEKSAKDRNRVTDICHQASASLVEFAKRRKFATVSYDDGERSFCGNFPWAKLKAMVQQKCDAAGITFETSGGDVADKAT